MNRPACSSLITSQLKSCSSYRRPIGTSDSPQPPPWTPDFRSRPSTSPDSPLPPPPNTMHTCDGVHVVLQTYRYLFYLLSRRLSFPRIIDEIVAGSLLLLLLTAAAEECVHLKRIPDAATANAAVRKAMQIYSRPTHASLHRQIRANVKVAHRCARREREYDERACATMARAAGDDAALGGGRLGGEEQGYPAASLDRAHGQPGTGGTEATGVVRRTQISSKKFIHLLASLNLLPTIN